MNAGSIPRVKRLIQEISREKCEQLVDEIAPLDSSEAIEKLSQEFLEQNLAQDSQVWTPNFGFD